MGLDAGCRFLCDSLVLIMKVKFVPQDCWIGLYWSRSREIRMLNDNWTDSADYIVTKWHLCLIPCFPIIWTSRKETANA